MTVSEVAAAMTERGSRYAVVSSGEQSEQGGYGLVTDALLRAEVVARGLPGDSPVSVAMVRPASTVIAGTLAAQALSDLTERDLDALLVLDRAGALLGIVAREDFVVSPSSAGVSLREQIGRTGDADQLVVLARRIPLLLSDLLRRGRSAGEVTTVHSTVIDAVVRRALTLVLAGMPDLDPTELTWLSLGTTDVGSRCRVRTSTPRWFSPKASGHA